MKDLMLSPWEACILWMCHGKSVGAIAALEGKSVSEIEQHLERARIALGAKSLDDAVLYARQIYKI
jgi:DNA-binding CsgD family transcriptional regulator